MVDGGAGLSSNGIECSVAWSIACWCWIDDDMVNGFVCVNIIGSRQLFAWLIVTSV